jgi:hypothetical protein
VSLPEKPINRYADNDTHKRLPLDAELRRILSISDPKMLETRFPGGFYVSVHLICQDCGKEELWTAAQQKWWYEKARGHLNSTAVRCRACRQRNKAQAQRVPVRKAKE